MLKYELDSLDGLDEAIAGLYSEKDGKFVLKVQGEPGSSELKTTLQKERDRADAAERELGDLKKQAGKDAEAAARAQGDIEALEKSLKKRHEKELDALNERLGTRDKLITKLLVKDEAHRIASAEAVDNESIEVLAEFIAARLRVEEKDGEFKTVVVDSGGKPTGLSVEDFQGDLRNNKSLGRLLKASNGSGGGASPDTGGGAAKPKVISRADFEEMTPTEKVEFSKSGGEIDSDL